MFINWSIEQRFILREYVRIHLLQDELVVDSLDLDTRTEMMKDLGFHEEVLQSMNHKDEYLGHLIWWKVRERLIQIIEEVHSDTWDRWESIYFSRQQRIETMLTQELTATFETSRLGPDYSPKTDITTEVFPAAITPRDSALTSAIERPPTTLDLPKVLRNRNEYSFPTTIERFDSSSGATTRRALEKLDLEIGIDTNDPTTNHGILTMQSFAAVHRSHLQLIEEIEKRLKNMKHNDKTFLDESSNDIARPPQDIADDYVDICECEGKDLSNKCKFNTPSKILVILPCCHPYCSPRSSQSSLSLCFSAPRTSLTSFGICSVTNSQTPSGIHGSSLIFRDSHLLASTTLIFQKENFLSPVEIVRRIKCTCF